jgi:amino acid permease
MESDSKENMQLTKSNFIESQFFNDDYEGEEQTLNCFQRFFNPIKAGSLRGSVITFASMCFGTAGLSLPVGMANVGLITGTLMFISLTLVCYWSLYILLQAGRNKKIYNYSKLVEECINPKTSLIVDVTNIIFCLGVLLTFQYTIFKFSNDTLKAIFGCNDIEGWDKLFIILLFLIVFQIPLGLIKNVSRLQYVSIVITCVLIYTIVIMIVECPLYYNKAIEKGRSVPLFTEINRSYLDSFSIFLYIYASHNGIFMIMSELNEPTKRRTFKVLNMTIVFQFIMFSMLAYSGFFSLLEITPDIFISRKDLDGGKDVFILIAKVIYILSLNCCCPIVYNIFRNTSKNIFNKGKDFTFKNDVFLVIIIFCFTNMLTFFIKNVVQIISILAGICGVILCFIVPVLCYINSNGLPKTHFKNVTSLVILLVIIILGFTSTLNSIYNILKGNS